MATKTRKIEGLTQLDLFERQMQICEITEPEPAIIYTRTGDIEGNEAKILLAGFDLVNYDRELKTISRIVADQSGQGWNKVGEYPTYAAAERALKEILKDSSCIRVSHDGEVLDNRKPLIAAGFEFYRRNKTLGDTVKRIKCYSKNWGTWQKYESAEQCKSAWNELMQNPKALEG